VSLYRSIRRALPALAVPALAVPALAVPALAVPALALLAISGAATAQAQDRATGTVHEKGAIILDYGIYAHSDLGLVEAPDDISGWRFTAANVRLLRRTQTILAQPGLTFGMRFRVTDPRLIGKTLSLVIRFPRLTNPATGKSGVELVDRFVAIGILRRQLFRFDYLWEMAEGPWIMTLRDGRKIVAEVPFRVVVAMN